MWELGAQKADTIGLSLFSEAEVAVSRGVAGFSGSTARRSRLSAGMTADQLAIQIGVAEQTILRWERREAYPTAHHLRALAAALDLDIADLLPRSSAVVQPSLRDLRHLRGLTIRGVAESSNISASALVRLERGVSSLRMTTATTLAKVYGATVPTVQRAHKTSQEQRLAEAERKQRHRE